MAPNRPTVTDLQDVPCWRYSNYDTPFWARPNSRPGRWHHAGTTPTQYLSLDPDGAWAELIRNENLLKESEVALVRMPLWIANIAQGGLVDYSTFDKAADAGFPPEALVDDDHERCRSEAARLQNLGFKGVLAPSAALPGVLNLTLWGTRTLAEWGLPPRLASNIAARVIAVGCPPSGIVERTRLRGAKHHELERYLASIRPAPVRVRRPQPERGVPERRYDPPRDEPRTT